MPTPRPLVAVLAAVAALPLGLAACRDGDSSSGGGGARPATTTTTPAGQAPATPTETVEIGLAVSLTGPEAATGAGLRDAAELAVRHANADGRVPGVTLRLVTVDIGTAQDGAAKAIGRLARRDRLAAIVAGIPAGGSSAVADALGDSGVALLDPFDADPALTPATGTRPVPTLFRLGADEGDLAPFAADYVRRDLGASTVALVGEPAPAATAALDAFATRLTAAAGTVAVRATLPSADDPTAGTTLAASLRAAGASVVAVQGGAGDTASLALALVPTPPAAGPTVVSIGGAGCAPGGSTVAPDGTLCVAPVVAVASLPSARAFVEDFEAAGFTPPPVTGAPLVYDAVGVAVDALARSVAGGVLEKGLRARVAAAVPAVRLQGATGTVAFDGHGDAAAPVLTVLRAEAGAWAPSLSRALG